MQDAKSSCCNLRTTLLPTAHVAIAAGSVSLSSVCYVPLSCQPRKLHVMSPFDDLCCWKPCFEGSHEWREQDIWSLSKYLGYQSWPCFNLDFQPAIRSEKLSPPALLREDPRLAREPIRVVHYLFSSPTGGRHLNIDFSCRQTR